MPSYATRPHLVSAVNRRRFETLAAVVDRTKPAFEEMARALLEIREGKLYRSAGYATFEDCCRSRFGFSRQYAYRLMAGQRQIEAMPALAYVSEQTLRRRRTAVRHLLQWAGEMEAGDGGFDWPALESMLADLSRRLGLKAKGGVAPLPSR